MPRDSNHSSFTIFGRRLNLDVALAILVGVLALALYVYTLAPSVISIADDTLEFQLVAQRGAIPHQTGYPLYALLLTLIARILPIGEVAFRANLLSALAASAAVGLTYLVGRKMGMWRVAAFFSAALLATAPTFWAHATVAEVYALHFALVAALIFSVLRWPERLKSLLRDAPSPSPVTRSNDFSRSQGPERLKSLLRVPLFFGLGLTHHSMIVLWAPAVGVYVLLVAWQYRSALRPSPLSPTQAGMLVLPVSEWVRLVGVSVLPLLLYVWLPLRAHVGSIDGTYEEVGFGCWVRACLYQGFLRTSLAEDRPLSFFGELTLAEIGWGGVLLALLGIFYLLRVSWRKWVLLVVAVVTNGVFAMLYYVPDIEAFWLPTIWGLVLLAGWGAQGLLDGVGWRRPIQPPAPIQPPPPAPPPILGEGSFSPPPPDEREKFPSPTVGRGVRGEGRVLQALVGVLLLVPLLWQAVAIFPQMDRSEIRGPSFNGRDVLAQPLPENGVIIGLLGEATYLRYLQEALGLRPDVGTVATQTDPPSLRFEAIEAALAAGQRPFLTRELSGAGERWSLSALGPLIEVLPTPRNDVPTGLWPLHVSVTEQITLIGWNRAPIEGQNEDQDQGEGQNEGSPLERITVAWQVAAPLEENLHVSARLVASDDSLLCEPGVCQLDRPPLNNAYPTTLWRPGEIVLDTYELAPPTPDAHYLFILYHPQDGREVGRAKWSP